jgi:hypothetical protein
MKYGSFADGTRYRYSRRSPREYTCSQCGEFMRGADNCFPGVCTPCRHANRDKSDDEADFGAAAKEYARIEEMHKRGLIPSEHLGFWQKHYLEFGGSIIHESKVGDA